MTAYWCQRGGAVLMVDARNWWDASRIALGRMGHPGPNPFKPWHGPLDVMCREATPTDLIVWADWQRTVDDLEPVSPEQAMRDSGAEGLFG